MIKVLGIGSPIGDDQAGWEAASHIKVHPLIAPFIPQRVQIESWDRPGIHLLDRIEGLDNVYLIDAMKTGLPLGSIRRYQNEEIQTIRTAQLSSHSLGVLDALELGRVLKLLPRRVIVYGIEIGEAEQPSTGCSSLISSAVLKLSNQVIQELVLLLNGDK